MLLRKILFYHILPAAIAVLICLGFVRTRVSEPPDLNFSAAKIKNLHYILHFEPYQLQQQVAFSQALKRRVPVLMGSSELTSSHLDALAHNFFNKNPKQDQFLSIGHAGFQSLGILTVLAANRALLKDSKITIILSPGWFEEQYCKGTSLKSFFEYATPNYMYQILSDTSIDRDTRDYIQKYVGENFDKISKPDATLRLMSKKRGSTLSEFVNTPFDLFNKTELDLKMKQDLYLTSQKLILRSLLNSNTSPYKFYERQVNWDSLMKVSKQAFQKISTTNTLSVEDGYYNSWLKNKRKKQVIAVDKESNQEYKDLEVLVHFLATTGCKPLFVIMPLNTKAHEDLSVLKPTVDGIKKLLNENGLKTLDMFNPNLEHYQEGVLEDIMHPYNLGWYQIDKFIVDNYNDGR
jgi:D-alanine transfer protein